MFGDDAFDSDGLRHLLSFGDADTTGAIAHKFFGNRSVLLSVFHSV